MGLFDLVREVGDQIYASVALATAKPASDETMAQVYDYWSMDNEDRDTLKILKFDLGYGTDAHVALEHIGSISKMLGEGVSIEAIAKHENLNNDAIIRIIKMRNEYTAYKRTGELPKNTSHRPIMGSLDSCKSFDKFSNRLVELGKNYAANENLSLDKEDDSILFTQLVNAPYDSVVPNQTNPLASVLHDA